MRQWDSTAARVIVFGLLAVVASARAEEPLLRVSEHEARQAAIEKPAPVYPVAARSLKLSGTVHVEAVVSTLGTVVKVDLVSGSSVLAASVRDALKKWRFKPFCESNGKPVTAVTELSFNFPGK